MSQMINFGIDLGTTNSLIAKFEKGVVEVFKNPIDFKETLPSVVGFRNDRILVGDQAKAFLKNDPKSVIGRFKRKMGTTESFPIQSLGQSKSPIELSALVLKELKTFIHTGEIPEAAVIRSPLHLTWCSPTQPRRRASLQASSTSCCFKSLLLPV